MAFLHTYSLTKDFKLNIECNHATLAGHSCEHEVAMASAYGFFGSLDANTGDPQTGWDTDQFLTDVREATMLMRVLLQQVCGWVESGWVVYVWEVYAESTVVGPVVGSAPRCRTYYASQHTATRHLPMWPPSAFPHPHAPHTGRPSTWWYQF